MARKITERLRASINNAESGDIKIFLVTLKQGDNIIRVCSQGTKRLTVEDYQTYRTQEEADAYASHLDRYVTYGLISKGQLYEQGGFSVVLSEDSDGTVPSVQISIPNVSRDIIEVIERLDNKPVKVDIELIFADAPDDILMSLTDFDMTNISYNDDAITGTISRELLFTEPLPIHRFAPTYFPFLGW